MTARAEQCMRLAAAGRIAKEIAQELGISERAVEHHLLDARRELGAKNTTEAVSKYLQARWRPKRKERKAAVAKLDVSPARLFSDESSL